MAVPFNNHIKKFNVMNLNIKGTAMLLKEKLEQEGYNVIKVVPGMVLLDITGSFSEREFAGLLEKYGFNILVEKDQLLVEQIKQAVFELIHCMNNMNSVVRKSEYLVEKLGKSYSYLSRVFSGYEPVTLEKYIILQKIERIKDLIDQDELTLSEISYIMDYSSVQYLSNQFKKITGFSVTEYKNNSFGKKRFIDDLGNDESSKSNIV